MRKSLTFLLLALVQVVLGALLLGNFPALAESNRPSAIFSNYCASCHLGGGNIILDDKNLHISALAKYHMDSVSAIASQVKYGKKAMPAFKGRLTDFQIEEIASYVLEKAKKGW